MARSRSTRATARAKPTPPAATAGKKTPKPARNKTTPARFVDTPEKTKAGKKAAPPDDSNSEPEDDDLGVHHLANQRATRKLAEQKERTEEQAKINGMLKREVEKAKKLELALREEQKEKRQRLKRQREDRREDRSPAPGTSGDSSAEAEDDSTDSDQDHEPERRRRRGSNSHGNEKINADLKKATRVDRNREKKNQRERAAHAETEFAKMIEAQGKDLSAAEKQAITDNMARQGENLLELVAEVESGHDQMKKTIAALKTCNTDTSVKKMITSMATIMDMEEAQQGEAHALTKAAFQAGGNTKSSDHTDIARKTRSGLLRMRSHPRRQARAPQVLCPAVVPQLRRVPSRKEPTATAANGTGATTMAAARAWAAGATATMGNAATGRNHARNDRKDDDSRCARSWRCSKKNSWAPRKTRAARASRATRSERGKGLSASNGVRQSA